MPRITVAPHTPALAADFNAVSDQSIMRFPTAAARTAAIPTPVEGMHTYRDDAKIVELYNGTGWIPILPGGLSLVAARRTLNIIPASGSQVALTMTGWASPPTVLVTPQREYAYMFTIAGSTATQLNIWVRETTGAPLPDNWAVHFHLLAVGIAVAGQQPAFVGGTPFADLREQLPKPQPAAP